MNSQCVLIRTFASLMLPAAAPIASAGTSHWICLDGNYLNGSCWDEGIPSDPGEVGVIDEENFGNRYTVTFDGDGGAGSISLAVPEARWFMDSSSYNPAFSFNVVPGAEVEMVSSSFDGGTGVYTNGGTLIAKRQCLIDLAGFEQNNLLRIVATGVGGNAELTVMPSFTNRGTMEFQGGCCAGNNAILIVPGDAVLTNTGGINLLAGAGNHFIDANLDNQGVINLGKTSFFRKAGGLYTTSNAINFGQSVVLNIDNGATFNQTAGLIDMPGSSLIDVDTGGSYIFDGGTLDGQARLTHAALSLAPESTGGMFEIRGDSTLTGDIGVGQSVTLFATGSNGLSASLTTAGDLTNNGTLRTTAGCCNGTSTTITVPDGSLLTNLGLLDLNAPNGPQALRADLDNQGTVRVGQRALFDKTGGSYGNRGSFTVEIPGFVDLKNNASFSQDGGTLDLQGATTVNVFAGSTFLFNGGDITGTGEVLLTDANLVIGPDSTGMGRFRFRGAGNFLTGDIAEAQSLVLQATGSGGAAVVTTTGDINNAGSISTVAACCSGPNTTLVVPDGSLFTNTGTIDFLGDVGTRTLRADFDNQGTVNISRTAIFDKTNGLYGNSGSISVVAPGSINMSNGASFSQDGGTLDLQDAQNVFLAAGSTFTFNAGDITGTGEVVLTNANLVIGDDATGQGRFRFLGANSTLMGDIATDQTIVLQASGSGGVAVVTATGDVTNAGDIRTVAGCCAGPNTTLALPNGLLTNTGNIYLEGTVGVRSLTADLDNQGNILIDRPSRLNKPDGVYMNQGTITIQPGDSLTVTGASFVNLGDGVITGTGTLNVTGIDFSNEATVAPGLPVGRLTVTGTYPQTADGTLSIEIAGTAPGADYDVLRVNGTASLDGTLEITTLDGYELDPGQEYVILTANSVNGTFDNVVGPGEFEVTYEANRVIVTASCPRGDLNGDCVVDLFDYRIFADCLGGPAAAPREGCEGADLDGDQDVDLADFARFQDALSR